MTDLNQAQKIVAKEYAGGEFEHLADLGVEGLEGELDGCGDTLFVFLMRELSDSEDCDSLEEAQRRVGVAIQNLEEIAEALDQVAQAAS